MLERRTLMQLVLGLGAGAVLGPGPAAAQGADMTWARLVGDLSGRPIFFFTQGTVWGFKPQADDLSVEDFARRLYGYSGVAARKLERQKDGSILVRQKSWAFYRDPLSDAITDRIPNPYTGAVDTAAPLSGPLSVKPLDMGAGRAMHIRRLGRTAIVETSAFNRFKSSGISWFKLEGNLEDYVCAAADLDNPSVTHVPNHYHQNLVAEWQTWTHMHGTPGHILFKGNGEPLRSLDQVPADQIAAIERFFPGTIAEVAGWQ